MCASPPASEIGDEGSVMPLLSSKGKLNGQGRVAWESRFPDLCLLLSSHGFAHREHGRIINGKINILCYTSGVDFLGGTLPKGCEIRARRN